MNNTLNQKANNGMNELLIREAMETDLNDVLQIERLAFGYEKEADLVRDLLHDPSAKPVLSLLAFQKDRAVGHILFTTAQLSGSQYSVSIVILAPLAIVPDAQKQGIGGKLIKKGLALLSTSEVDLVFVLGHPDYYPRHGFKPAGNLGFDAPYPIPEVHANAWMVKAFRSGVIGTVNGKVICADALDKAEHWRE
jgi:putative acetyltransferase